MLARIPFLVAVSGMAGGVFIAILFGANEDLFHRAIQQGLRQNQAIERLPASDKKKALIKSEEGKAWRYYQRFHFHSTGIGAMSVALLLLLCFLQGADLLRMVASYCVSVGGALYPFVWLFAALYGPQLGRAAAKERFAVFGYMGGLFLVGVLLTLGLVLWRPLRFPDSCEREDR